MAPLIWKRSKHNIDELQPEHKGNLRYESKEKIGKGSYGKVVRAYDTQTKQYVAIKKMALCSNDVKNYVREVILLKNNTHANRLKLLDIYVPLDTKSAQSLNKIYLVTVCMDRSLDAIIEDTSISLMQENIAYMTYQVLCAVGHMHKSNLIHRDLKPENIGVTKSFHVKLLDYGFSRKLSYKMTTNIGSDNYRAPEVLLKRGYDEKVDLWSVGCVFAELLLHRRVEFNKTGLLDQHKNLEYKWDEHFGDEHFQKYLNKTDEKVQRYMSGQNARELLSKLLTYDADKRIDASNALKQRYVSFCGENQTK
ncbi:Stress-activated protein kinase JNK [Aphelenchoides bicaudatus]|nr:Stress-activated protein kinase JNK [Aphelenchoides bicaudatus]